MPSLANPRWEAFALFRAEGYSVWRSYLLAGYDVQDYHSAAAGGHKLMRNPIVCQRIEELSHKHILDANVLRTTLAAQIDAAVERADMLNQPSVMIAGAMAKAQLFGLIEKGRGAKVDVNVNGPFDHMTEDELLYEIGTMFNEIRVANGRPAQPLPPKPQSIATR